MLPSAAEVEVPTERPETEPQQSEVCVECEEEGLEL